MNTLQKDLGVPKFRALMVARILSVADRHLFDFENSREIGDYAELGLWLLEGMPVEMARAATKDSWTNPAVDPLFEVLIGALPQAVAAKDVHDVIRQLTDMSIAPLCAQNIEHMLCEFRKMILPEKRSASGQRYEGYAARWQQCEPIFKMRSSSNPNEDDRVRKVDTDL